MVFSHNIVKRNYNFINDKIHNKLLKDFGYFMKSMMKIHHTWLYWPIVEWQNKIIIYMCECPEIFLEEFCEENNLTFINKKYFNDKITSLGCIYTIERN